MNEVVRRYAETARLRRAPEDPAVRYLYEEPAAEDVALADERIAEYGGLLRSADEA